MGVKKLFFAIFSVVLVVALINFFWASYLGISLPQTLFTGMGITGSIGLSIEGGNKTITIDSPQNTTYNFDIGNPYNISLNVSANFVVSSWNYSLYDLRHQTWVYQNVSFTPNTTFLAARWDNELTVFARELGEDLYSKSVRFNVNVPNSAPILNNISNPIYVCEASALSYDFNAVDADEDTLISDISPKNPFFTQYLGKSGYNVSLFRIFSGTLGKSAVGTYEETITVDDEFSQSCCVDTATTNITVIEINNEPTMGDLGAQTVWTAGDNSTFYHQINISDIENGNATAGNYSFNLTFGGNENLFGINNTHGIINYTPTSDEVGVYALTVCANDTGLSSPHQNISLCAPNGGSLITTCDSFTLTVTNNNRPPEFINYTPNTSSISLEGESTQTFSVWARDPDLTIPDIDWYVDNVLQEHNENTSNDTFSYTAPCSFAGTKIVKVQITDGLETDSFSWNVAISSVACSGSSGGGGGGGGGGGSSGEYCRELWACEDWEPCLNVFSAHSSGKLFLSEYNEIRELCFQNELGEDNCGYQKRTCTDTNECNTTTPRIESPIQQQICEFVEGSGCFDGVRNCHSGSCEVKIDCGGPCKACPTCSDGRKNQGEEGIDCGGPCPTACIVEIPATATNISLIVLIVLLILALSIIIWRGLDILLGRNKRLQESRLRRLARGKFK